MTETVNDGYDPDHPDPQHEEPGESTDNPADTRPGKGTADLGETPAELPDPEED